MYTFQHTVTHVILFSPGKEDTSPSFLLVQLYKKPTEMSTRNKETSTQTQHNPTSIEGNCCSQAGKHGSRIQVSRIRLPYFPKLLFSRLSPFFHLSEAWIIVLLRLHAGILLHAVCPGVFPGKCGYWHFGAAYIRIPGSYPLP